MYLSLVLLGSLLVVFVGFGWKAGLLAVVLAFVYGAVSRPVAARIAARLISLEQREAHRRPAPPESR